MSISPVSSAPSLDAIDAIARLVPSKGKPSPVPLPKDLVRQNYGTMRPAKAVAPEKMPAVLNQLDALSRINFSIEDAMILLYRLAMRQRESESKISAQEASEMLALGKQVYSKMMESADLSFAASVVSSSMTIGSATISAGFGVYGYKAGGRANADSSHLEGHGLNSVRAQSILQVGHGLSQMSDAAGSFAAAGANFASKKDDAEVALLQSREKFTQVQEDMSQKFADEMRDNLASTRSTLEAIEQSRSKTMSTIYEV